MGFTFYSPITINAGQVPSPQSDFPMLISYTDDRFKTTGGHVSNANGYDIRPYSDIGLTKPLTYELERYNASTGEVIMWVRRSYLSDGVVTYLGYGDSTITTDGSSAATWCNSFGRVYHLRDGVTLSLVDSTGNPNLTNTSGVTAGTGKIDGAASFVRASNQHLDGNAFAPTALTYSCWINATTLAGAYQATMFQTNGGLTRFIGMEVKSTGKMRWSLSCTTQIDKDGTGSNTLLTGTWYYIVMTYNSTAGLIGYVNGSSDNTNAANGNADTSVTALSIGVEAGFSANYWNGLIDEVRMASVARSQDWVTAEYNNQSAPSTFATLGTESAFTPMSGLFTK